jgi:hypothetical protein
VNLIRTFIIVVPLALFCLLNFATLAVAQSSHQISQSEQMEEKVKNVASLTTTDLLSKQDFVPAVMELPAARSKTVNQGKGVRGIISSKASDVALTEEKGTGTKTATVNASVAAVTEVMQPAVPSARLQVETTSVVPPSSFGFSTGNQRLDEMITQSARRNGIDHRLILAVMKQESSFNTRALSYKGARGLMQLMPATASRFGVTDIYDPAQNIEGGARYLRFLLNTFNGNVELALAGYNAGEHAVYRYGNRIPPYRETQDYVRKISAHYARLTTGGYVQRPTGVVAINKKPEMELITVGQTMTQY